jgi:glycosyl transferase family 2
VRRWADERAEARARRDFAGADRLRDLIAGAGWTVTDRPDGFDLSPAAPPEAAVSVLVDLESWPADAERLVASLPSELEVVPVAGRAGFGASHNAALQRARGKVVVLADASLEVTGDLLGSLQAALTDPTVAVAGPFGLASTDLRDYEERTGGDVVAVQGYCLAARRSDLLAIGGVRETFAFYRNADIDTSLRLRTAGPSLRRAVAVGTDQCRRHTHRAWETTPADERDRLSRRNMRRVLDRFGDRVEELAVP